MKFTKIWSDENLNPIDGEGVLMNYGPKANKVFGYGVKQAIVSGKGKSGAYYLTQEEAKRAYDADYAYLSNPENVSKLREETKKAVKELKEQLNKVASTDLTKLSNEELMDAHDYYWFKVSNAIVCYTMSQPARGEKIEAEIDEELKKVVDNVVEARVKLTTADNKFHYNEDHIIFQNFHEVSNQEIDRTVATETVYTTEPIDQTERKQLLAQLDLPKHVVDNLETLRTLAEERLILRFEWMKAYYLNQLFVQETARRHNITSEEFRNYTLSELQDLIANGNKVSEKDLEERRHAWVSVYDNGKFNFLQGKKAQEYMKQQAPEVEELKGMVANTGNVTGRVIKFSHKDAESQTQKIENMSEGDILVAEMTHPDILAACKKAGAIVTDEGGILSHAAIISRELNIPAVIGTKHATEFLNDGDLVEVDAKTGVVATVLSISWFETSWKFWKII